MWQCEGCESSSIPLIMSSHHLNLFVSLFVCIVTMPLSSVLIQNCSVTLSTNTSWFRYWTSMCFTWWQQNLQSSAMTDVNFSLVNSYTHSVIKLIFFKKHFFMMSVSDLSDFNEGGMGESNVHPLQELCLFYTKVYWF